MTADRNARFRILLVEDEPLIRWVERKELEGMGHYVTEAESCRVAEEFWTSRAFDLVVLDHRLPDGLGRDLLLRMRQNGRREPVIYLSAEADCQDAPLLHERHVLAALTKPLNPRLFSEALAGALESDPAGAGREPASSQASPLPPRCPGSSRDANRPATDRYTHIAPAGRLSRQAVLQLENQNQENCWLALEMAAIKEMDIDAFPALVRLATACSDAGGRLCLVGLPEALLRRWSPAGLPQEIDIVCGPEAIEALGRRLATLAERAALLDSVVPRTSA